MAEDRKSPLTRYQVLRQQPDTKAWKEVGQPRPAANDQAAIRAEAGETEGTYRAVPARNWGEPVTLTVKTKKVVSLSSDGAAAPAAAAGGKPEPAGVSSAEDGPTAA